MDNMQMQTTQEDYSKWYANITTADNCYTPTTTSTTSFYCKAYPDWYNFYQRCESNHTLKAFQVAKKLIAGKHVKADTVDKFIALVDVIEKELR